MLEVQPHKTRTHSRENNVERFLTTKHFTGENEIPLHELGLCALRQSTQKQMLKIHIIPTSARIESLTRTHVNRKVNKALKRVTT